MTYHFARSATQAKPGLGVSSLYCPIGTRCVVPTVKAEAEERCDKKQAWGPLNPDCAELARKDPMGTAAITSEIRGFFSPCEVAHFVPVCGDSVTTYGEPEDDDGNQYMVGGILAALLLASGVGYMVFKKKKKGRR